MWSKNRGAQVGSAIYSENSRFVLLGSTIFFDTGAELGGGMFLESSDSLLMDNVIEGNQADYGGGLAIYGGRAELTGNRIVSNGLPR